MGKWEKMRKVCFKKVGEKRRETKRAGSTSVFFLKLGLFSVATTIYQIRMQSCRRLLVVLILSLL